MEDPSETFASMQDDLLQITIANKEGLTTISFDPETNLAICRSPVKVEDTVNELRGAVRRLDGQYMKLRENKESVESAEAQLKIRQECQIHILSNKLAVESSKIVELEEELDDNEKHYRLETSKLREKICADQIKLQEMEDKMEKLKIIDADNKQQLKEELKNTKQIYM